MMVVKIVDTCLYIIKQSHEMYDVYNFKSSNEVYVSSVARPEARYGSFSILSTVYLRGTNSVRDKAPLMFNSFDDLIKGLFALTECCKHFNVELKVINKERICL